MQHLARAQVPNLYELRDIGSDQAVPVRAERDVVAIVKTLAGHVQSEQLLTRERIPHPGRLIDTSRGQARPLRTEDEAVQHISVTR